MENETHIGETMSKKTKGNKEIMSKKTKGNKEIMREYGTFKLQYSDISYHGLDEITKKIFPDIFVQLASQLESGDETAIEYTCISKRYFDLVGISDIPEYKLIIIEGAFKSIDWVRFVKIQKTLDTIPEKL